MRDREEARPVPVQALFVGLVATVVAAGLLLASGTVGPGGVTGGLVGYGLAAAVVGHRRDARRLGLANAVTLTRVVLVCLIAALAVEVVVAGGSALSAGLLVGLALVCLGLDGVDGALARRRDEVSAFGARFDVETDAALLAVVGVATVALGAVGGWALLLGALRYAYVLAARFVPALREPLPPRPSRRVIGVLPVIALVSAVIAHPLGLRGVGSAVVALALGLVVASFAVDIVAQAAARSRRVPRRD